MPEQGRKGYKQTNRERRCGVGEKDLNAGTAPKGRITRENQAKKPPKIDKPVNG